jgi:hypothetical protein
MKYLNLYILSLLFKNLSCFTYDNFIYGKWNLRYSNDEYFNNKYCYLLIDHNKNIKLRTISYNGIITQKISRTGVVEITNTKKNNCKIQLIFNKKSSYSYSIIGIKIPEIKNYRDTNYNKEKIFECTLTDKSFYAKDNNHKNFYLFDLANEKSNDLPHVEISF